MIGFNTVSKNFITRSHPASKSFGRRQLYTLASLWLVLAACSTPPPAPTLAPTSLAQVTHPTATPLPSVTATITPSPTIIPSATPTPTPTLHPMMIEALRQLDYSGSDLVIERELDPGVNYRRYYVSYLSEGLTIYALLTVPNGERPATGWPVIIFNHGFIAPTQYRTTERYVAYVDNLARNGYIVLRSDYRGHDQSEGEANGAYSNPGYVIDVLNAVGSMKRFPEADPERIGMWGHSMGGYITLRSMVITADIKAGVIWAGVVADYPDLFARGTPFPTPSLTTTPTTRNRWRTSWIQEFGTPEENPAFWNAVSANAYLADLSGPLQLHHGTADTSVPLAASQTLYEQMLAANQTVEFYTYDGDNHNLAGYFTTAMNRTLDFFNAYLKDDQ